LLDNLLAIVEAFYELFFLPIIKGALSALDYLVFMFLPFFPLDFDFLDLDLSFSFPGDPKMGCLKIDPGD